MTEKRRNEIAVAICILTFISAFVFGPALVDADLFFRGKFVSAKVGNHFRAIESDSSEPHAKYFVRYVIIQSPDREFDAVASDTLNEGDRVWVLYDEVSGANQMTPDAPTSWTRVQLTWVWPVLLFPSLMFLAALIWQGWQLTAGVYYQLTNVCKVSFSVDGVSRVIEGISNSIFLSLFAFAWLTVIWLAVVTLAKFPTADTVVQGLAIAMFLGCSFVPSVRFVDNYQRGAMSPLVVRLVKIGVNAVFVTTIVCLMMHVQKADVFKHPASRSSIGELLWEIIKTLVGL